MLGFHGEYPAVHQKAKFCQFFVETYKKSAVKHFMEKASLLNFENLSRIFCPRLSKGTDFYFKLGLDSLTFHFLKILLFENTHSLFTFTIHPLLFTLPKGALIYLSKNTILHSSIKYAFGKKTFSSGSRAVFMESYCFYLLKTDHF